MRACVRKMSWGRLLHQPTRIKVGPSCSSRIQYYLMYHEFMGNFMYDFCEYKSASDWLQLASEVLGAEGSRKERWVLAFCSSFTATK